MSSMREGRVIAARYQLERPLARGGMGSVWVARHLQLDSILAIKFIEPQLAHLPEARGRFEREAKVNAQLQGPNLVQIHDYGIDDGTPYMVMEYLQGEDLCARLAREKRLSLQATADIVNQVARVLRRAHEAGIVHRDLKPGNIFLVGSDEDEIVKVLDFGLAKVPRSSIPDDMTKTGTLLGSPRYMSPEQARAMKNIDHRSDLWSLAVIAFRAVTGALPFPGDEIGDVLVKICAEPAPAASSIDPALSPAIDRFFERAFEHDPIKRFQSAREMAKAFTAATTGQTVSPISTPALGIGAARVEAPKAAAAPAPVEVTRPSATLGEEASTTPTADGLRMGARLSWIGARSESPAGLDLLALPAGSRPRRARVRLAAAAFAALAAGAGLMAYATFSKGPSYPPAATATAATVTVTATAILGAPPPQPSSAPAVIVDTPLPPAITATPDPSTRPASPRPAGASSAAPPRSAPKPPSTKRKNPILGI